MVGDAAEDVAEQAEDLPADTARALGRLPGGQLRRKDPKLTRRRHMPRNHAPKRRLRPDALVTQDDWEEMREIVFFRAEDRCERCAKPGSQVRLDPHHRQPVSRGGPDAVSNLACLCAECHDWAHNKEPLTATGLGFLVPSRADPERRAMLLRGVRWVLLDDAGGYIETVRPDPGGED